MFIGVNIYSVNLNFIHDVVTKIISASHINYLKTAQLTGSVFNEGDESGAVSSVFTAFYVDHVEPLEALEKFKLRGRWCLGELLDGHKYLAIFPVEPLPCLNCTLCVGHSNSYSAYLNIIFVLA